MQLAAILALGGRAGRAGFFAGRSLRGALAASWLAPWPGRGCRLPGHIIKAAGYLLNIVIMMEFRHAELLYKLPATRSNIYDERV